MSEPQRSREPDFDPLDEGFTRNPHPVWADLRSRCPVARGARWDFWALTKYQDVKLASRRPELFTSSLGITVPRNPVSGRRAPLHFDPPEHPRYRRPLNAVLSKERVASLEPKMRETARELVSTMVVTGGGDAVRGLSSPLAGLIFGMFIGISPELARDLNAHSERFESAQFHQRPEIAEEENLYLYGVFRELVAERRANRMDPGEDVVSALLDVSVDGAPLDDEFIAGSIRQLLIAAHVAPSAAIASAVRHLAEDPVLQDELRQAPDQIPAACDELLRLYTPNQGFARTATRATRVRGQQIEAGEQVALVLTSANRDPDVFTDPDCFVLGRSPNPHIAFGWGSHKCAGKHVAETEIRLALQELLAATDHFVVAGDVAPVYWPLYGPEVLPLRFERR
ncbi:MAG TPA: cytochrome P450 [Solirubrobacteraceae bacterium]|nr:cytochrome P450 [Solirubrobacteraceae bacterium]